MKDLTIIEPKPDRTNLICTFGTGKPGKSLILKCHLNTKYPIPLEARNSDLIKSVLTDGRFFGLRATDMKGSNAAMVYGLAGISRLGEGDISGSFFLVLHADKKYMALEEPHFLVKENCL